MTHAKYSPPVDPLNLILGSLKISARQSFNSGDNLTVSHLCPLRRNSAVAKLDLLGGRGGAITSADPNRNENIEPKSGVKSVGADQIKRACQTHWGGGGVGDSAPLGPSPCYGTAKEKLGTPG